MMRKSRVENFIIPRSGVAVPATGARLYNLTTDAINLGVGGFGAYTGVAGSGNPAGVNSATISATSVDYFQFFMRRDMTNDATPLGISQFETSPQINASCFLRATGAAARVKLNSSWVIGDLDGNVGAVPVLDETEYIATSGLRGWRVDLYNGNNTPTKQGRFTSPEYSTSTVYTTTVDQRDHLMQHVAYDYNSHNPKEVVAICIDTNDVGGAAVTVADLTTGGGATAGTSVIIGYTDENQAIRLYLDNEIIATFDELVANGTFAGTEGVVRYARPSADNLAAPVPTAGDGTNNVDKILFLALDAKEATYDEVSQTKARVTVGLTGGFGTSTLSAMGTAPSEGSGYYKEVLNYYRGSHGHRKYIGNKPWQQYFVEYTTELVPGAIYDIYVIDSCNNRTASSGMPSVSPERTVIAIQNFETPGFVGYTGVANAQKTYVQAVINNYMNSTTYPHTTISL